MSVTRLRTLPELLRLVYCPGCGAQWEDMDAATHQDGYSATGCPNECGRLTEPVYQLDQDADRWRAVVPVAPHREDTS